MIFPMVTQIIVSFLFLYLIPPLPYQYKKNKEKDTARTIVRKNAEASEQRDLATKKTNDARNARAEVSS